MSRYIETGISETDWAGNGSERTFELIPSGTELIVKIEDVEDGKTLGGERQLRMTLTVIEGQHKNRRIWENCGFKPNQVFRLRNIYDALEIKPKFSNGKLQVDPGEMLGRTMLVTIRHNTWNGKTREQVSKFKAGGPGMVKTEKKLVDMTTSEILDFAHSRGIITDHLDLTDKLTLRNYVAEKAGVLPF